MGTAIGEFYRCEKRAANIVSTAKIDGIPKEDAEIRWYEGYLDDEVDKGLFTITRIIPQLFPAQVTIIATAAPFKADDKTGIKERRDVTT